MESQEVCGFGVDIWTKVIAWTELAFFSFGSVASFQLLYTFMSKGETRILNAVKESTNIVLVQYHDASFGALIAMVFFLLALSIMSFLMALVLLRGAQKKNAQQIMSWFNFTLVSLVLKVMWIVNLINTSNVVPSLLGIILIVSIVTFGMSLVYTFKMEIDKEEKLAEELLKEDNESEKLSKI